MIKLLNRLGIRDRASFWAFVKQFIEFGVVGLSNTLISLAIYYILVYLGVHYILANVIAYFVSVLNAYYWNSRFVFKRDGLSGGWCKLINVYVVYGITLLLGTSLLFLMVDIMGISEYIAPAINLCVTIPLNFLLNKFWVFR